MAYTLTQHVGQTAVVTHKRRREFYPWHAVRLTWDEQVEVTNWTTPDGMSAFHAVYCTPEERAQLTEQERQIAELMQQSQAIIDSASQRYRASTEK